MKDKQSIHEKAIRLIEGGIVDVDGHSVKLVNVPDMFDTCNSCEMDCLCHIGTEMYYVCIECVGISKKNCILKLVTSPRYARGFSMRDEHAESGQCDCQTMGGLVYSSTRNQCAPVICAGWNHGRADFN